ncbi:hypothetical protein NQ315_012880 [Exocentrus adspersus]|uniref:Uncharacterized protein n=1 Tax=Exocentrus adspersus TaxID=1586481 RepID=A0AAV8VG82_9CUCU|nr:hypothetical protein NQ315_012880 [Exocentrus adspersus]
MHPFSFVLLQALYEGDAARRVEFCETFLIKLQEDNFTSKIIWTDESKFTNEGIVNRRNIHHWAQEKPHCVRENKNQNNFKMCRVLQLVLCCVVRVHSDLELQIIAAKHGWCSRTVICYKCKKRLSNGNACRDYPSLDKDELIDRCLDYTGACKTSIYKILREENVYGKVQPPKPKSGGEKIVVNEDAKYAIRRAVHEFFRRNELPTLNKVLLAIRENEVILKMGKDTLAKTLKTVNFTYGKVDRKCILIERFEIVAWRMEFLRKIRMFRNEGKIWLLANQPLKNGNAP